ncbi:MAG: carbohydrate-binding domain-containing protein, partial [Clostridia bacterium]|nr:carbohydrate-binding domain-containing protein [Clostridia bacterium]
MKRKILACALSAIMVLTSLIPNFGIFAAKEAKAATTEVPALKVSQLDAGYSNRDQAGTWTDSDIKATIALSGTGATVTGTGASASNGVVTITEAGYYMVSGSLNGQICVETAATDKVQLIFNGVTITNTTGPAVYLKTADKVFITLPAGTSSTLKDGAGYTNVDATTLEPNACLFSKVDLTINGSGTLSVTGSYDHAINSKDDLVICNATINVPSAAGDGMRGKDLFAAKNAKLTINATGDGIQSSDTDVTKGNVILDNSTVTVTATADGIQAENQLQAVGSTIKATVNSTTSDALKGKNSVFLANNNITVTSSGDGIKASNETDAAYGNIVITSGTFSITATDEAVLAEGTLQVTGGTFTTIKSTAGDGIKARDLVYLSGATMTVNAALDGIQSDNSATGEVIIDSGTYNVTSVRDAIFGNSAVTINGGTFTVKTTGTESTTEGTSSKGIKSDVAIYINGGSLTLTTSNDAVHSNGVVSITGCDNLAINSGDDGIHAENNVSISGGTINITNSYEGIEAMSIDISGGNIKVKASDDGINAAGGADSSGSMGGGGNQPPPPRSINTKATTTSSTPKYLHISGGTSYFDSSGDGLDSNGALIISGGTTVVNGPTTGGNGVLDYDGIGYITGGTLVASGLSDMAMTLTASSTQHCVAIKYQSKRTTGFGMSITNGSTTTKIGYDATKQYNFIVVSSPAMKSGSSLSLYYGATPGTKVNGLSSSFTGGTSLFTGYTLGSNTSVKLSSSGTTTSGISTGGSGTLTTTTPNSEITLNQVLEAINRANNYLTTNSALPDTLSIANGTAPKTAYVRLALQALLNILNNNFVATIPYIECTEGTTATASTFSSSTISKLGYTYLATRMLAYMNDNALTYANYISYPGTSGLSYSGLIGFDTGARIIARVLGYYYANGVLPSYVAADDAGTVTPPPPSSVGSEITLEEVLVGMISLADYEESNGTLPAKAEFGDGVANMASYCRLACVALENINKGDTTSMIPYVECTEPSGYTNSFSHSTISKEGYLDAAKRTLAFTDNNSNTPPNYLSFPGANNIAEYTGLLAYDRATQVYVRALSYYATYGVLPSYVSTEKNVTIATPAPDTTQAPATAAPTATPTVKPTSTPTAAPTTQAPTEDAALPTAHPKLSTSLTSGT